MCQAGLYFLYILSVNVVALHSSSGLPGQDTNSGWSLGKTQWQWGLAWAPQRVSFILKAKLCYMLRRPPPSILDSKLSLCSFKPCVFQPMIRHWLSSGYEPLVLLRHVLLACCVCWFSVGAAGEDPAGRFPGENPCNPEWHKTDGH